MKAIIKGKGLFHRFSAPLSNSTRMGGHATELIANGQFGRMITLKGNEIASAPLEEIAGKLKLVTEDNDLVVQGRRMGICFG